MTGSARWWRSAAMLAAATLLTAVANSAGNAQERGATAPGSATAKLSTTATDQPNCNSLERPVSAGGASLVPDAGESVQHKSWQPPGGEVQFTISSSRAIPADAQVLVCFRWAHEDQRDGGFIQTRPSRLDLASGGKTLEVVAIVPRNLGDAPSRISGTGIYAGLWLAPLADVRLVVLAKDKDGGFTSVTADVLASIGITDPFWGALLAFGILFAALTVLSIVDSTRLKHAGIGKVDPLIRIIATRDGHASLSRLQMIVWTLVVATSAIYVMALSGELLQVTTGTLALLGISGVVSVGTELHRSIQTSATSAPIVLRKPLWSDLILTEPGEPRGIDIARMQMLYFTLITAAFVMLRVATTFVIPEIPQGFQILMGISSAIYMGSKLARPTPTTASAAENA